MIELLLELIYPNVCAFCEKLAFNGICSDCKQKIEGIIISKVDNYTSDSSKFFNRHGYIFKYGGEIRDLIINYKFNNKAYIYKTFANIILDNKKMIDFINTYELVMPVPIHKKRYNIRGYNQSELLSKEICKNIKNIKFRNNILIKSKNNVAQSTLNKVERALNVKNVYKITNSKFIEGKRILLIDDVYTTGNTVNECARVLKENGAHEIGVFTISKD